MKVEIETEALANLLKRMPDTQIVGLFWYVFGYCGGSNDTKFFEAIVTHLAEKTEVK